MPVKKYIISILSSAMGSLSSKRLCGIIGWLICIGILIFCTITKIQAPDAFEVTIITSSGLLGLDTITNIWKKPKNNDNNDNNIKDN